MQPYTALGHSSCFSGLEKTPGGTTPVFSWRIFRKEVSWEVITCGYSAFRWGLGRQIDNGGKIKLEVPFYMWPSASLTGLHCALLCWPLYSLLLCKQYLGAVWPNVCSQQVWKSSWIVIYMNCPLFPLEKFSNSCPDFSLVSVIKDVLPVASWSSPCLMIHTFCLLCDSKNELFLVLINSSYTFYICLPSPEIATLCSHCNNTCVLSPARTVAMCLVLACSLFMLLLLLIVCLHLEAQMEIRAAAGHILYKHTKQHWT